jgi:carbon monoxide dehydrogenase subunit G
MEFTGEFNVSSSPEEVWEFLLDPSELENVIPNCQNIEEIDETSYTAEIGVSVSHVSVTFDVNGEIVEQDELEYMCVNMTGNAKEGDSRMNATGEFWMEAQQNSGTHIEYKVTQEVTGRIMNMGSRLVKAVSKRQIDQAITNLQTELNKDVAEAPTDNGSV